MRAKLVLLAAAALVFTPGWHATDSPTERPALSELAGSILAPTFDEASVASKIDRVSYKQLERTRSHGASKALAPPATSAQLPALGSPSVAILLALVLAAITGVSSATPPRAPPHLVTV